MENSLVVYKSRPARVLKVAEKLDIELESGQIKRVRNKDVMLLHEGPLRNLAELTQASGEVEEAWELLAGGSTNLEELTELVFGEYSPSTAWAAWQLVMDGLYFIGTPDDLEVQSPEHVEKLQQARAVKVSHKQEWSEFIARLQMGELLPSDAAKLADVEALAWGQRDTSRILHQLGRQETCENAHAFLLKIGHWDETMNPYPIRIGLPTEPPELELGDLEVEDRLDLTHLPAFAIDDEGNQDPDDAISLEGNQIWVHVADVAALVKPDTAQDLEARTRGASLYLPDRTIPMLAPAAVDKLGLGLQDRSPALSFNIEVDSSGKPTLRKVTPSWVSVTRLSYTEANQRLNQEPLCQLWELAQAFRARRIANGATEIHLPEIAVRVQDGKVTIRPLPRLESRTLVTELMLMTGEAAARFAVDHAISFPFSVQNPTESVIKTPGNVAEMFALRKTMKRSQLKQSPAPHAGLGLEMYTQVTSPLRRYLDLVAHQQLRAFTRGEALLNAQDIMLRVGAAEAVIGKVRRTERLSNKHWTLVYLRHHAKWRGRGIAVEQSGSRLTVLVPELGLDATVSCGRTIALNTELELTAERINLPSLSVNFRI